ncbi:hypothetical protein NKH77_00570 [Streptomyces sp. M19]
MTREDILRVLAKQVTGAPAREVAEVGLAELGEILRYFGRHVSDERLLPKYGYASPGSLYATQMYLELDQIAGVPPGFYYYHPVRHELVLIAAKDGTAEADATRAVRRGSAGCRQSWCISWASGGRSSRSTRTISRRFWRSRPVTWWGCSRRSCPVMAWVSPVVRSPRA